MGGEKRRSGSGRPKGSKDKTQRRPRSAAAQEFEKEVVAQLSAFVGGACLLRVRCRSARECCSCRVVVLHFCSHIPRYLTGRAAVHLQWWQRTIRPSGTQKSQQSTPSKLHQCGTGIIFRCCLPVACVCNCTCVVWEARESRGEQDARRGTSGERVWLRT